MAEQNYHLAQINVARLLEPLNSPQIADFVAGLEPINALAEQSPGFVWRLKDETGNATNINPMDDDMLIINMSVWEDLESLKNFTFKTVHVEYVRRRFEWFEKMKAAYTALWWVKAGHIPNVSEAVTRLKYLRKYGETGKAFTFKKVFGPPTQTPLSPPTQSPEGQQI